MIIFAIFAIMISSGLSIAAYILQSYALMEMLQAVGYKSPWQAWVPIINAKAIGSLADSYDNGRPKTNYGKILLGLNIALLAIGIFFAVFIMAFAVLAYSENNYTPILALGVVILWLALFSIAIISMVFMYIALWNIFKMFSTTDPIVYLLLSIFVSALLPILLFILRKNPPKNLRGQMYACPPPPPPYYYNGYRPY